MHCIPVKPFDSQSETLGDTMFSNFWFFGQNPKVWPFTVEQYFTVVLFVFQFIRQLLILRKFINFGFGAIRSERVNMASNL